MSKQKSNLWKQTPTRHGIKKTLIRCYTRLSLLSTRIPPSLILPGGWTECIISAPLKSTILSTPDYPLYIKQPDTPAHRISESPGKGLGMFATRKIAVGALILAERALMISPGGARGVTPDLLRKYPRGAGQTGVTLRVGKAA